MLLSIGGPFAPRTTGDILTLWMDRENQKHGRALRRRTTCQVPLKADSHIACRAHAVLCKDLVAFGLVSTYGDMSASRFVLFAPCTHLLDFTSDVGVGAAKERKVLFMPVILP